MSCTLSIKAEYKKTVVGKTKHQSLAEVQRKSPTTGRRRASLSPWAWDMSTGFLMLFISSLLCWHLQTFMPFAIFTTIAIGAATYKLKNMKANYFKGIYHFFEPYIYKACWPCLTNSYYNR
jgi:hypothetical protein